MSFPSSNRANRLSSPNAVSRPVVAAWLEELDYDPLPFLLNSNYPPVIYFTRRDLLRRKTGPVQDLWRDVEAKRILASQKPDGYWEYPGGGDSRIRSLEDYNQLETYRQLGFLVEKFGLNRTHPSLRRAAEFLFAHQTTEGDFRGIYGRQYTPNYSAGMMELLVKAGYGSDRRIQRGFRWLLSMRQLDGGWAIPLRTAPHSAPKWTTQVMRSDLIRPDFSRPSSHLVTGVVLRAFAAHDRYRRSEEARAAGRLLARRFFKGDTYIDRKAPEFWGKISFPFWFTDVVSALDSLSQLGFQLADEGIGDALDWLRKRQADDGSFRVTLLRTRDRNLSRWVSLAICRIFKRFYLG
jgi:hypothetical protein